MISARPVKAAAPNAPPTLPVEPATLGTLFLTAVAVNVIAILVHIILKQRIAMSVAKANFGTEILANPAVSKTAINARRKASALSATPTSLADKANAPVRASSTRRPPHVLSAKQINLSRQASAKTVPQTARPVRAPQVFA